MKNSKKIIYTLLIAFVLFLSAGNSFSANVDVYNNGIFTNGYASLDLALAMVGVAPNTGVVEVKINASHTTGSGTIGNSSFLTCKIYPTANGITVNYILTGTAILLSGADNVTIDGSLNGTGTTIALTLNCTNNSAALRGIQTQNGSQNVIIKYVNVNVPVMTAAVTGGRCINIGQSTTVAQGGQDNNTIEYCNLSGGDRTIQTFGSDNIAFNTNTIIRNNIVRNAASLHIFLGSFAKDITCEYNVIYDDVAVYKGGAAGNTMRGIGMQGCGISTIRNNIIHDLTDNGIRTTPLSIQGMICIPVRSTLGMIMPATNSVTISNNMIRLAQENIKSTSTYGLFVSNTSDPNAQNYTANVYHNSSIIGGTGSLQEFTYGLIFNVANAPSSTGTAAATYYNNVALNVRAALSTSQHTGMDFEVEPGVTTASDYNTAYSDGPSGSGLHYDFTDAAFGYNSNWSWKDANCPLYEQESANHPVNYDINFAITNQNYGDLNAKVLASVTTDLFGNTRNAAHPYRGAVEGPELKKLSVTACLEGRDDASKSQMTVALYDGCTFVDYASGYILNGSSTAEYFFSTAVTTLSPSYRLQCLTSVNEESWSSGTVVFSPNASYAFNDASDIYGSNGTAGGCFYAADVNQDGIIDASDLSIVENDASVSLDGCRVQTDINGDGIVDASDLSIVENNSQIGLSTVTPCSPRPSGMTDKIKMNLGNKERVRLDKNVKKTNKEVSGF